MSNNNNEKIDKLIEEANSPKDRAFLIVLQQINTSLIANTLTINSVSAKLSDHLTVYENSSKEEQALLNKGKGFLVASRWAIGIIQAVLLFVVVNTYNDLKDERKDVSSLRTKVAVIEKTLGIK